MFACLPTKEIWISCFTHRVQSVLFYLVFNWPQIQFSCTIESFASVMTSKKCLGTSWQHIFSLLACWGICPFDFSELLISSRQTLCRARFKSEASILGVEKGSNITSSQSGWRCSCYSSCYFLNGEHTHKCTGYNTNTASCPWTGFQKLTRHIIQKLCKA